VVADRAAADNVLVADGEEKPADDDAVSLVRMASWIIGWGVLVRSNLSGTTVHLLLTTRCQYVLMSCRVPYRPRVLQA
jgi:hypothetical protein